MILYTLHMILFIMKPYYYPSAIPISVFQLMVVQAYENEVKLYIFMFKGNARRSQDNMYVVYPKKLSRLNQVTC